MAGFAEDAQFSRVSAPGAFGIGPVEELRIGMPDGVTLHGGLWRPVDPRGERVPVILTVGPYFGLGEPEPATTPGSRLGRFLVENYVPHGYAVAQVSVRGTGESGGCMDFFGMDEQRDLDALVTWFGTRAWSTGAVGMAGKSYDGTTPWEAAASGNPHLRTIVPMEGITSLPDLMYHNGSSELRGPIMAPGVYWPYGLGVDAIGLAYNPDRSAAARAEGAACPAFADHVALHAYSSGTGDWDPAGATDYWTVRDFRQRVLDHYRGSVFIVHGLQDWNVDPAQVAPLFSDLPVEKKLWLGQWAHHYPDRREAWSADRDDFADVLLAWFDHHLKDQPVDTGPTVEVRSAGGSWHAETTWPPQRARMRDLALTAAARLADAPGPAATHALAQGVGARPWPETALEYAGAPFASDTRLAGMPQLPLVVTPATTGGHLYAELWEEAPDGARAQVGRAWMNLRHHLGGNEEQVVVPGVPIPVLMEFQPLDAIVPAGHALLLVLYQEASRDYEPLPSPESAGLLVHVGAGGSLLRVPVVDG